MNSTTLQILLLVSLFGGCQPSSPSPAPAPESTTETATETRSLTTETDAATPAAVATPAPTTTNFDELWNYQDPAATRGKFEALLDEEAGEWPLDLRLQLMTQIARTLGLEGEFESSHGILDEVEQSLPDGPSVARVRYLLERGRSFRSDKQTDRARPLFVAAWEMSRELGEGFHAVDAAHMLGILEQGQASLDWNLKALEAGEASSDPRAKKWLGAIYNNTGWTHHDNGDYEAAMDLWVKAEVWYKEFGSPRTQRVALWAIARCERSMENYERALELQMGILAMDVDPEETGYAHEEAGENLWAMGRKEQARTHFAQAHEILSKDKWMQDNEGERLERLSRLASGADH